MKKQVERRFLPQEFRVADENQPPRISGYAAVFDSMSEDLGFFREEIDSHAFDNVMGTSPDVRALFNHDANCVLGRTKAGTLRLNLDARGLAYEIDPPDTQVARDLMVSMRRGDVTQSSYAFIVKRDQWTDNADGSITRRVLEIEELFDVSPVTYPGFASTSAQVHSLPRSMPAELRARAIEKRDPADGDGCDCGCPECMAGNCEACTNTDCDDPGCRSKRSAPPAAAPPEEDLLAFRDRMNLRLRMMRQ
jgi:HK97 family phage prohead protease